MSAPDTNRPDARPVYRHALDCGHRTWLSTSGTAGIDWCYQCGLYRGIVTLSADPRADLDSPTVESAP